MGNEEELEDPFNDVFARYHFLVSENVIHIFLVCDFCMIMDVIILKLFYLLIYFCPFFLGLQV